MSFGELLYQCLVAGFFFTLGAVNLSVVARDPEGSSLLNFAGAVVAFTVVFVSLSTVLLGVLATAS